MTGGWIQRKRSSWQTPDSNSFHMLLTWSQSQRSGQFIWNSEKRLVVQHGADGFERRWTRLQRTGKTNCSRFKDAAAARSWPAVSAQGELQLHHFQSPDLGTLCSQLLHGTISEATEAGGKEQTISEWPGKLWFIALSVAHRPWAGTQGIPQHWKWHNENT